MRRIVWYCVWVWGLWALPAWGQVEQEIEHSVVLITNHQQMPNWQEPWEMSFNSASQGTGFLIEYHEQLLIITNAHVVSNPRLVLVNKSSIPEPFIAEVAGVAHDSDLAVLRVKDPHFYEGLKPLVLGSMPGLQSRVRAYGYPVGGRRISRTEGVVSRVEFGTYVHPGIDSHLLIQTDSAINPGNSGGPIIQEGKVVGVAFQSNPGLSSVGYMIPIALVQRFLKDLEDGRYEGVPEIGLQTSPLLNRDYRSSLGLSTTSGGVVVDYVLKQSAAEGHLQAGDVLLEIEGSPIDSEGMIHYEGHEVLFHVKAEEKQVGEALAFKIWRKSEFLDVKLTLRPPPYAEQLRNVYDELPQYLIFGGLVFMPLTRNYLQHFPNPPLTLMYEHLFREVEAPGTRPEQIIVLANVLPSAANAGYTEFQNYVVSEVNGLKIQSLRHLKQVLTELPAQERYYRFKSLWDPRLIVLEKTAVEREQPLLLQRYGISQGERL